MVLAIKHRASYYKRFEVDVWGILKSTPISRPRLPTLPIFNYKSLEANSVKFKELKRLHGFLLFWINRKSKSPINPKKRRKNLRVFRPKKIAPWHFLKSNKIERIRKFFYSIYKEKQSLKRQSYTRYIYRIDIVKPRVFRKALKMRFVSIRLTKLFYLTFTYRQFRRLAFEMRRKDGYYGHNFCLALEGRLVSAIYRSSLVSNLFQSIQLVKQGYVAVNKVYQKHVNYRVKVSEFITFELLTKRIIYFCLLKRLACRAVVFNPPRYMFVSYSFLFAYMKRPPSRKDLVFPVGIDLYRATGYAY